MARAALPGNIMLEWLGPQANLVGAGVCALFGWLLCAAAPNVGSGGVGYALYFVGFLLSQGTCTRTRTPVYSCTGTVYA